MPSLSRRHLEDDVGIRHKDQQARGHDRQHDHHKYLHLVQVDVGAGQLQKRGDAPQEVVNLKSLTSGSEEQWVRGDLSV